MPGPRFAIACAALAGLAAAAWIAVRSDRAEAPGTVPLHARATVQAYCSTCHKLPPPDTLPRSQWRAKVEAMYALSGRTKDKLPQSVPPIESAIAYYEACAPEWLPPIRSTAADGPGALATKRIPVKLSGLPSFPGTANVSFVHLHDPTRYDLLISEMCFGMVLLLQPYESSNTIQLLARVPHPCHAEVVDLDRDGIQDVLVADLGTVTPSDVTKGSVVWLRGAAGGKYEPKVIASELVRVADAQAADFDGDGDLDVVAAVFGWRAVGQILYLENQTTDPASPRFEPRELDPRPGAIHVPVRDLNGDGLPDFVALISQHFETVVAFVNKGKADFRKEVIFEADHPNWGSSGIDVVDLDGDADLDVLLANGDTLDDMVLKPYHGIEWLENRGRFPFEVHRLTSLYGVHRAKAADLDMDGDLDVAAASFLPFLKRDMPGMELADSVVWLERTAAAAPGGFVQHNLESVTLVHPTLDTADYDADGDVDIALGNMTMAKGDADTLDDWVILLQNLKK